MLKVAAIVLTMMAFSTSSPQPAYAFNGVRSAKYERSAYERAKCISEGRCAWSHAGFATWIPRYVGKTKWVDENLAMDQENWDQVIEDWKNSPTHARNLRHPACFYGAARYKNVYVLHQGC